MPMHPLLPLIAIGLVFVLLILPIFLSYALRPKGNPAASVAADWPSTPGRILTHIKEQLVSARYVSQREFTGPKLPGQKVKVRGLQAEAIYWVAGRTYTIPLFSDWDFSELQAQCSIEELDRRLSGEATLRVFYNPQDPQKARVDYTSLPAEIQPMLAKVSSQK